MGNEEKLELPLVSFVMTTWNRREELIETLNNIKRQNYSNYEVIVVDNNSIEKLSKVILEQYPRVKYIKLDYNSGSWAGRDIAMQHANGKYICSLDDDSFPGLTSIDRAVSVLENDGKIGIIAMDIYDYDFYFAKTKRDELSLPIDEGYNVNAFIACGAIFRSNLLDEIGMWEHWFSGGTELSFSIRTLNAGYDIKQYKDIYVYHKEVKKSRPNQLRIEHGAQNQYILFWTYHNVLENVQYTINTLFNGVLSDISGRNLLFVKGFIKAVMEGRQKKYKISKQIKQRVRMPTQFMGKAIQCADSTKEFLLEDIKRILLFRTLPMQRLPLLVSLLKRKFPNVQVEVITHTTTSFLFNDIEGITKVHYYEHFSNFNYSKFSSEQINYFKSFDMIVFGSYKEKFTARYLNIQKIAKKLSIPLLSGLHESGKMIKYDNKDLTMVMLYSIVAVFVMFFLFLFCLPYYIFKKRVTYYFKYKCIEPEIGNEIYARRP